MGKRKIIMTSTERLQGNLRVLHQRQPGQRWIEGRSQWETWIRPAKGLLIYKAYVSE